MLQFSLIVRENRGNRRKAGWRAGSEGEISLSIQRPSWICPSWRLTLSESLATLEQRSSLNATTERIRSEPLMPHTDVISIAIIGIPVGGRR